MFAPLHRDRFDAGCALGAEMRAEHGAQGEPLDLALPRGGVPSQFDALVHVDETRAVEPLDRTSAWDAGEPETFPSGL